MAQFPGHEVVGGKCVPVVLEGIPESENARARSSEPGAKVEWHEVKAGNFHLEGECEKNPVKAEEPKPVVESKTEPPATVRIPGKRGKF